MANPYGFSRGLPNRRAQIIQNSTQRAQAAQRRANATLPGNSGASNSVNATASVGSRGGGSQLRGSQLTPQRVNELTQRLKQLRGLAKQGTNADLPAAFGQRIKDIRGKLAGRRITPAPLPGGPIGNEPPPDFPPTGTRPPGEPSGPLPPTVPPVAGPPGVPPTNKPRNAPPRGVRGRVGNAGGYRGRPIR